MSFDKQVIVQSLNGVLQRIAGVYASSNAVSTTREPPRLVAVSKTFPAECITACYGAGQRHFGENYLQELSEKASALIESCPDICWHYIGRIQSNKIRKICETPGLWCIQTLESVKHADLLQKSCAELGVDQLNVFIQVNTSREPNKGGVELDHDGSESSADRETGYLEALAVHIASRCPNLKLLGLMTIGSFTESTQADGQPNHDFAALVAARQRVSHALGLADARDLELSMGMSHDFESAVRHGATTVRVGSLIFGDRRYGPS